jgi:pSer/pThr/pTyr-binding forkhead associated (FHA) protein/tetratricopeptide (TPR) repeat protein
MWVLVLTDPAGKTRQIPFEGDQLVLGRSRSADVSVDDARMSRMHLRFARGASGSLTVEDLGAANGVFVQSQRIGTAPMPVSVGDQIQFGDCRVVVAAPVSAYAPGLSQASLPAVSAAVGMGAVLPWSLKISGDGPSHTISSPMVVGRSLGADVSLDHASVSRRHALLVPLPNGQLRIEDAGGTNGTFVAGQRIDNDFVLRGETAIVFGELDAVLKPIKGGRKLPFKLPKVDRDLAQKFLVLVLGLFGLLLLLKAPEAPRRSIWEARTAQVERNLSKARNLQMRNAWQQAVPVIEAALADDPLNQEARQLRDHLKQEIAAQREFEEGIVAFDTGDYDRALNSFGAIPVGTRHHAEAQEKRISAQDRLLAQYKERAERACRDGRWKSCQREACTYLAYSHAEGLVRLLARAESRLSRGRGFERCEVLKAREDGDPAIRKAKEALALIYPDARLRTAMAYYATGKVPQAERELSKVLGDSRRRSLQGQASALRHDVQRVQGYVKRMREVERSGDMMLALRQWGMIRKVDKELLQGTIESRVLIENRALLVGFLLKRSADMRLQKRFEEALGDLGNARRINPSDVQVTAALKKLASEAPEQLASKARDLLLTGTQAALGKPAAQP